MKLRVTVDNRGGAVTAKAGSRGDARDANYNIDPSKRYAKLTRTLSETSGSGGAQISSTLETSSEFVGFVKDSYECDSLAFRSAGTVKLPSDPAAEALGVVQDSIALGFRVERTCRVHLTATVMSDMDVAEVKLMGPGIKDGAVRVFDDFDEEVEISKPGDYELRGAYQLNVRTPNTSLGGRPISVEMQATLKPVG
ncbi:MAG TPA: hypothetical protein VGP08_14530 [Pyrinomonadaceae bacterium]|jgi:hypothetical protein|nr:hypothetical protein [Pyrinomonadaceae bacterium]